MDVGLPTDTWHKKQLTMAIIVDNLLTKGISGTFGKTIVFKQWRNKTIIANYSKPTKKHSETQKANRSKFRDAANWAKATLKDPEQKTYYQEKARKLGLPNAYTAAITDYMRKPQTTPEPNTNGTTYRVYKNDFGIKQTEVQIRAGNEIIETKIIDVNEEGVCIVERHLAEGVQTRLLVTDATGRVIELALP